MANNSNFLQAENSVDNLSLLNKNHSQLESTIYSDKEQVLLVNLEEKTFWITCQEGLKDAKKIIKEKLNQKIINFKNIQKCLNYQ